VAVESCYAAAGAFFLVQAPESDAAGGACRDQLGKAGGKRAGSVAAEGLEGIWGVGVSVPTQCVATDTGAPSPFLQNESLACETVISLTAGTGASCATKVQS
jgi:hypothetical protein